MSVFLPLVQVERQTIRPLSAICAARQMRPNHIGRWLFTPDGITDGYLRIEGSAVTEVVSGTPPSDSRKALILPGFVNAHTHIGDSVGYPAPKGSVREIVGPPDGYKFRILTSATKEQKKKAIKEAVDAIASSGTALFVDFREEGIEGVKFFKSAMPEGAPDSIVLGRPAGKGSPDTEIEELLMASDGIGMSALSDWPLDLLQKASARARSMGKLFSLHASEATREDIDAILDLKPSFVIHMASATDDDLIKCRDAGVPIVVCPRANEFFGLRPDIPRLVRHDLTVGLGTDNGMISKPDMLLELQAAYRLCRTDPKMTPSEIVYLATFGGHKVLNAEGKITTEISQTQAITVVDIRGEDPLKEVVTTASSDSVSAVIRGGRIRRPRTWRE